jgi:hypothetical protein
MDPHATVSSDNSWQRVLRATQSTWREQQGLEPARLKVGGDERLLGSRLTPDDSAAGRNFLTETTWRRVQADLATNAQATDSEKKVLEPDRLKDNLLSSQPLCFNLFAELDDDRALATRAFRLLWPSRVHAVERIEFEWSPGRGDQAFLGNRSAFDVAVFHTTPVGGSGVLGIEVKYHENLKATGGEIRKVARDVAERTGLPVDLDDARWRRAPLNQFLLDHLLALSITHHPEQPYGDADFCLVYPAGNLACTSALDTYKRRLGGSAFEAKTLEQIVGTLRMCTDAPWVGAFADRYLGYDRAFKLGQGLERPPRSP